MKHSALKLAIFEKLAEVEALIQNAQCDGEQLVELECFEEVDGALAHFSQTIEYYID